MKTTLSSTTNTLFLAVTMLSLAATFPVHAGGANPRVLPINSSPFGKSYGEWAAAWWQWALSIPADSNPLNDATGANASIGQSGPVWFLAGANASTTATRGVTVPAGKALFFPLAITIQEIRDTLTFVTSMITDVTCTVDGVGVNNPRNYVQQSPMFSITVPANNIFGSRRRS